MSRRSPFATRALAIRRLEAHLRADEFPRLQMTLLVALTGGTGLLASFLMLRLGLDSMALRYPLALAAAYLFFLFLLWLWLRTRAIDYLAAALAIAALYAVYIAPVLFAELLVDGALSYALFRHLRAEDRPLWLASALRHTAMPFAATAVFLAVIGAALSAYAPQAQSIGQVIGHAKHEAAPR